MANRCKILIIDDNINDFELCARILQRETLAKGHHGVYEMVHASSGEEGLKAMAATNPDLILLDYSLPGENGLETLKKIQRISPNLPVIMLTEIGNEGFSTHILNAGAKDFLAKANIRDETLVSAIRDALKDQVSKSAESVNVVVRLLIVDDSTDDREMIVRRLKKIQHIDFVFREAGSGEEAFRSINDQEPDCVLLDYSMPGHDGLQVLSNMVVTYPFLPIIILTGQGNETIATEAIKNGAQHYLVKSTLTTEILDSAISSALEHKALENKIALRDRHIAQYQQSVLESRERLNLVLAATNVVTWDYDLVRKIVLFNDQVTAVLGYHWPYGEVMADELECYIHPSDISTKQAFESIKQNVSDSFNCVQRMRTYSGAWKWIKNKGRVVARDNHGMPIRIVGTYQDITDEKNEDLVFSEIDQIGFDTTKNSEEKIRSILKIGLNYLRLETAILSKIDNSTYTIIQSAPDDSLVNTVMPLIETYCVYTFPKNTVNASHWVDKSEMAQSRCYLAQGLESYIGVTVFVNQKPYGTLNFIQKAPRDKPFSVREKAIMNLMAQWIGNELTRKFQLERIEKSEAFLNLILDSSPNLIFVKDDQCRLVHANTAFLNLYPKEKRKSLIGTTTYEIFGVEQTASLLEDDIKALNNGNSESFSSVVFPDGGSRVINLKTTCFLDNNTKFLLALGVDVTDLISAKCKLVESEKRFQLAVKGSGIGLWDWNIIDDSIFLSDRLLEILGFVLGGNDEPATTYTEFSQLIHPVDQQRVMQCINDHLQFNSPYDLEYQLKTYSNNYIWVRSKGEAIRDEQGKAIRMAGSVVNISQEKAAVDQIMKSNEELERFAYLASHDLQEPLRMVTGFTDLLEKNYGEKLDTRALEYIHYASSNAKRMQTLIVDLLEYARIGKVSETINEIDLNNIILSVKDNLESSIKEANAIINCAALPFVKASPVRMLSLFQNLIGNAIKYRKAGHAPYIDVSVFDMNEERVIVVSDDGIGMKQEYCTKIFEPFQRLHRSAEYTGTGMGLAICRKIVEEIGGRIWAESEIDIGTKILFTIPKA